MLPDGWQLDNYYRKFGSTSSLTPKDGEGYVTKFRFDKDGDGTPDITEPAHTFDLRFTHRNHSGVIWLRAVPLSQRLGETDLRVLTQGYLEDVAGAGYEAVELGSRKLVVEKRFAAELVGREEGTLGRKPAFAADFFVANVDQVRVTSAARDRRVKIVIVRPGFTYSLRGDAGPGWANSNEPTVRRTQPSIDFPVILIAGLATQPEDFERALPDFNDFLNRLAFQGSSGVELHAVASPSQSPAAAAASAVEPPNVAPPNPASNVPSAGAATLPPTPASSSTTSSPELSTGGAQAH